MKNIYNHTARLSISNLAAPVEDKLCPYDLPIQPMLHLQYKYRIIRVYLWKVWS